MNLSRRQAVKSISGASSIALNASSGPRFITASSFSAGPAEKKERTGSDESLPRQTCQQLRPIETLTAIGDVRLTFANSEALDLSSMQGLMSPKKQLGLFVRERQSQPSVSRWSTDAAFVNT